ncbi:MAG: hypothetical protein WCK02_12030 [Bacteroidota bacterium]
MKRNSTLLLTVFILFSTICFSQTTPESEKSDSSKVDYSFGADLSSRYLWRGKELSKSPCIQPTATFSLGNFSICSWSSYTLANESLQEFDIYLSYKIKNITLSINDYFVPDENLSNNRYFIYDNGKTSHAIEASAMYSSENNPFSLTVGTFVYGADNSYGYDVKKDTTGESYYSSYAEIGYAFTIKQNELNLFCGLTPWAGYYGNTMGVINAGISMSKEIEITDKFSLPIKGTVMANPQTHNIFFGFAVTL